MRPKKVIAAEIEKVMGAALASYNSLRQLQLSIEAFYAIVSIYPAIYIINLDKQIDSNEEKLIAFLTLSMTQMLDDSFPIETIRDRLPELTSQVREEIKFLTVPENAARVERRLLEALRLLRIVDGESVELASEVNSQLMYEVAQLSGKEVTDTEREAIETFLKQIGLYYIEPVQKPRTEEDAPAAHHLEVVFGEKWRHYQEATGHQLSIQSYYALLFLFPSIHVIQMDKKVDILETVTLESIKEEFIQTHLADEIGLDQENSPTLDEINEEVTQEIKYLLTDGVSEQYEDHFIESLKLLKALAPTPYEFREMSATISEMMHTLASMSGFKVTDEETAEMSTYMKRAGLLYIEP
jgi:Asp-tRNA(Asn)/Glu-tRNA(Gln) amidotransferase C subunit